MTTDRPRLPTLGAVDTAAPPPGPTADVSVSPAVPDDAAEIARIQVVTWRTAYRSLLPASVLDSWDDDAATAAWHAAVTTPPTPSHGVLVARERSATVGFAAYGPPEADPDEAAAPDAATVEVAALLVEPRWGRRGHGSRLLAAVADLTSRHGGRRLQAWIPEPDTVTAAFLESAGWAPDGWRRTVDTGDIPIRLLRWHTVLEDR